jgi:hypothetical protein
MITRIFRHVKANFNNETPLKPGQLDIAKNGRPVGAVSKPAVLKQPQIFGGKAG